MKKLLSFIIFMGLFVFATKIQAQHKFYTNIIDSIRYYKKFQKPSILIGFDNKVTFLGAQSVKVNGIRIGANYNKFNYFLGLYGTRNDVVKERLINLQQNRPDTIRQFTSFGYLSLGFTYTHWATKHWLIETTGQLGVGSGRVLTYENSVFVKETVVPTIPIELGSKAYYMITPWIGIGAGIGVRKAVLTSSKFDGIFYSTGIRFLVGKFYKSVIKPGLEGG